MTTKDLNNLMKRQNISKDKRQLIKQRRRTLKNRNYAANSRFKRCDEEDDLLEQIEEHEQGKKLGGLHVCTKYKDSMAHNVRIRLAITEIPIMSIKYH